MTSVHSAFDPRIFHKEAKSLVKAGYEVSLIAQHSQDEIADGIRILALHRPRNRLRRMLGGWRVFRLARREKADVYHFHDPELLPVGLLLKLLTKAKVVYDVHEDYPADILTKYWLPTGLRRPASIIFDLIERPVSTRVDSVVAATDSIGNRFRKGNLTVIHNYPVPALLERPPRPSPDPQIPMLVYAGALSKERGITEIVEAMRYLDGESNAKLLLYGRFSPGSYEEVVRGQRVLIEWHIWVGSRPKICGERWLRQPLD